MNRYTVLACAAAALAVSSTASAQLVFSTRTSVAGAGGAFHLDVTSNALTRLWTQVNNKRPGGLAADEVGRRLYEVDSARLGFWEYGTIGTVPTFVSTTGALFRATPGVGTGFTATGVDGLEFVNGTLYGWTNFGSTINPDGIYKISLAPATVGFMTPQWSTADDTYDFEGLAYNAADGFFYGTNNSTNIGLGITPGLYKIDAIRDPSAVPVRVASYDPMLGLNTFDGLAIGGGSAWLTRFVNGVLPDNTDDLLVISKFNLTTGVYDDSLGVVIPSGSQIASGAAWAPGALIVPEPSMAALGLVGAAIFGSRRRSR